MSLKQYFTSSKKINLNNGDIVIRSSGLSLRNSGKIDIKFTYRAKRLETILNKPDINKSLYVYSYIEDNFKYEGKVEDLKARDEVSVEVPLVLNQETKVAFRPAPEDVSLYLLIKNQEYVEAQDIKYISIKGKIVNTENKNIVISGYSSELTKLNRYLKNQYNSHVYSVVFEDDTPIVRSNGNLFTPKRCVYYYCGLLKDLLNSK